MEKHLHENLAGKLEEFSSQASSIEGWLTREEKKFQAMGGVAPNLEVAMKQKPRVEVGKVVVRTFIPFPSLCMRGRGVTSRVHSEKLEIS